MKQNKSSSVKKRITLFFVAFTAFILLLLWICQFFFLDSIYYMIRLNDMESAAESIVQKQGGSYSIAAENVNKKMGMCVTVFNSSSFNIIYSGDGMENCTLHRMALHNLSEIGKLCNDGTEFFSVTFEEGTTKFILSEDVYNSDRESSVLCITSAVDTDGVRIYIFVNANISPVGAVRTTMFWMLSVFSVMFVATAFVLAYIVSKHIAKPIVSINQKAKRLAQGDFSPEFESEGYLEARELSQTLNYAATELGKVENLRRELIANLSHDLRTPLTLISSYSEMMRDIPGELNSENLKTVIDETNRLNSLVNDMMNISKLESGNVQIEPSEFSVTDELLDYVCRYNEMLSFKGYRIEFNGAEEDATVCADRGMILQAFGNLLNNAVTYTGEDKFVSVCVKTFDDRVRVEVKDTGEGISKSQLPYIWDRYYKVDSVHKRSLQGSGLGLSIVKKIIELHKGNYGVRSGAGGSTFWFEIEKSVYHGEDN